MIRLIQIVLYSGGDLSFIIYPAIFSTNKVFNLVEKIFSTNCPYVSVERNLEESIVIRFKSVKEAKYLIESFETLFSELNRQRQEESACSFTEFPKELIQEMENILYYSNANEKSPKQHILPEKPRASAILNPAREQSNELLKYFKRRDKINIKVVLNFLRQGENPNQLNFEGESPLQVALLNSDRDPNMLKAVKALVWYGAFPALRSSNCWFNHSPIELTKKFNYTEAFNIFMRSVSKPKRDLKSSAPLKVSSLNLFVKDKEIITRILFSNSKKVISRLMTTEHYHLVMDNKQKTELYNLFTNSFRESKRDAHKIAKQFGSEFSAEKNKWIDIIVDEEEQRIMGFFLQRVAYEDDKLILKIEYGVIGESAYLKSAGLAEFFSLRAGLALKALCPTYTVQIYALALHYFSLRVIQGELTTPKYLPNHMLKTNQKLVNKEFRQNVSIQEGCYIEHPSLLQSFELFKNRAPSFEEECVNEFIFMRNNLPKDGYLTDTNLSQDIPNHTTIRAAVCSTVVGQRYFSKKRDKLLNVGIELSGHIPMLAAMLHKQIDDYLPLVKANNIKLKDTFPSVDSFKDEQYPFWFDINKPYAKL